MVWLKRHSSVVAWLLLHSSVLMSITLHDHADGFQQHSTISSPGAGSVQGNIHSWLWEQHIQSCCLHLSLCSLRLIHHHRLFSSNFFSCLIVYLMICLQLFDSSPSTPLPGWILWISKFLHLGRGCSSSLQANFILLPYCCTVSPRKCLAVLEGSYAVPYT